MTIPVYFGMPLRSRRVSHDWTLCCSLLDQTLTAILTPERPDVTVLIACHERPDSSYLHDPRVRFLVQDHPAPTSVREQTCDKITKVRAVAAEACRAGGGYFVLMDADDIVSHRLIDYIRTDDNRRGYSIEQGYVVNARMRIVRRVTGFPRYCGSCAVFYLRPEDAAGSDGFVDAIAESGHMHLRAMADTLKRPLDAVPFPAMLYLRHHGDNLSVTSRPWYRFTELRYSIASAVLRLVLRQGLPERILRDFTIRSGPLVARRQEQASHRAVAPV